MTVFTEIDTLSPKIYQMEIHIPRYMFKSDQIFYQNLTAKYQGIRVFDCAGYWGGSIFSHGANCHVMCRRELERDCMPDRKLAFLGVSEWCAKKRVESAPKIRIEFTFSNFNKSG